MGEAGNWIPLTLLFSVGAAAVDSWAPATVKIRGLDNLGTDLWRASGLCNHLMRKRTHRVYMFIRRPRLAGDAVFLHISFTLCNETFIYLSIYVLFLFCQSGPDILRSSADTVVCSCKQPASPTLQLSLPKVTESVLRRGPDYFGAFTQRGGGWVGYSHIQSVCGSVSWLYVL